MMTTNKNQRTTHIDDVVKYQPKPFFVHCAICDFFYNYLCMHSIFADENDEITHTYIPFCERVCTFVALSLRLSFSLLLPSSHSLALFHFQFIFHHFYIVCCSIYFFATLYFILLFVCAKLCVAPKKSSNEKELKIFICIRIDGMKFKGCMKQHGRSSLTTHKNTKRIYAKTAWSSV